LPKKRKRKKISFFLCKSKSKNLLLARIIWRISENNEVNKILTQTSRKKEQAGRKTKSKN
jgi:hypothetical protein